MTALNNMSVMWTDFEYVQVVDGQLWLSVNAGKCSTSGKLLTCSVGSYSTFVPSNTDKERRRGSVDIAMYRQYIMHQVVSATSAVMGKNILI